MASPITIKEINTGREFNLSPDMDIRNMSTFDLTLAIS